MSNTLELTWYGKDKLILVESHLLIENAALFNTATEPDTENMLTMMSIEAISRRWKARPMSTIPAIPIQVSSTGCTSRSAT